MEKNKNKKVHGDKSRNVLLVTAHPDDESYVPLKFTLPHVILRMFFVPTIQNLIEQGDNVFILCLSTGNVK